MKRARSKSAWQQALGVLAGGVNSPVRAFNSVGGTPVFVRAARGAYLFDADGNEYIDYVGSWGPAVLGHAHPEVVEAVCAQAAQGLSFGAPTQLETDMALAVREFFPSMERIRFVNSGTEACMSAVRLARGHTGRKLILTFAGCYHGHGDSFLGNAGSGLLTMDITEAAGVVPELSRQTLSLPYNDVGALERAFERHGDEIAAVIVEPIGANMNLILPDTDFLRAVVDLSRERGALSIFDEVISGFRVHPGGAQAMYRLRPDLTTLGKIVGGGMPVGAYGGRAEVMASLAPAGRVYQAGTLSGNPLAMRAGFETLRLLKESEIYERTGALTARLTGQMNRIAKTHNVPLSARSLGSLFGLHFLPSPARRLSEIQDDDHQRRYRNIFHRMLECGVYLAPSPFEAGFVSGAHTSADIERTLTYFDDSCAMLD